MRLRTLIVDQPKPGQEVEVPEGWEVVSCEWSNGKLFLVLGSKATIRIKDWGAPRSSRPRPTA